MIHYADEDLILYYYGEGPSTKLRASRWRAAIERHLDECPSCAASYRSISSTLTLVMPPNTPARGEQYGLEVWQRIRHRLPEQHSASGIPWLRWDRLGIVAAAAVLVAAAFIAGRVSPRPPSSTSQSANAAEGNGAGARQRILLAALADHLDGTERVLTDIMHASDRSDISTEQRWADDPLAASRLYRQDAEAAGEQSIAVVLDDLERSLLEIVHSPSPISAADLEQIRRRIDAAALLFKVRVLSDDLRQRESAPAGAPRPRTSTRTIS